MRMLVFALSAGVMLSEVHLDSSLLAQECDCPHHLAQSDGDFQPHRIVRPHGDCEISSDSLSISDLPDKVFYADGSFDPLENLILFLGLEGSKQPQDFGANAHFGGRFSANVGLPLSEELGLGVQVGTAINYTDNAVQVFERVLEVRGRSQSYTTIGLFQRHESGLVWALAWDHLYQSYFDQNHLNQIRGRIGFQLTDSDELGLRASASHDSDRAVFNVFGAVPFPVMLEPLSQGSVYWKHNWESQVETMFWVGVAESHGQRNIAFEAAFGLPPQASSGRDLLFGAQIHVPLNDHWALFGQGNFVTPAYTGTVDSYLGIAYYPGGGARRASQKRFAPVIPVANSTSMTIDLR